MLAALRRLLRRAEREDVQPTAVVLAARNGDTASVQALVREGGVDVNASGEFGRTALFEAARNGHTETVRALEACGADVNSVDMEGETPLFAAASEGHMETVRALVACGAHVSATECRGRTPVWAAAECGHTACVRALAAHGADVHAADHGGRTPVWAAAEYGHAETVLALVEFGADASAADHGGRTPVWAAAENGHAACVLALVACGADASAADLLGATPVWAAAETGRTACVRALVACGADVHTADKNGATPVWIAACWGRTETVRALVREFGADVHTADKNGATPVWIAAFSNSAETVLALVQEFDADINTANKNGVTPVLAAVRRPFTKMARALVECGADPWTPDEDGWCPLEVAAEAGATGLLLTMLRESSAAHGAARERRLPRREQRIDGDASALRVLAAVARRAGHADTAAMLEWLERLEKVQALVESGADPWTPDEDGWCPLEVAAEAGATGLLWAMLRESAAAHGAAQERRLPRREQRIDGDASALRVLAAVARRAGHADTAAMLEWLEGLEKVNPEGLENANLDYADANDEARRRGFECPVCFEETDNAVALVPCGHRVCRDCWKQTSGRGGFCPMCRVRVMHAAQPESWPPRAPLFARFCVQL